MALGSIVVNANPLFIRTEKFQSVQMTLMTLTMFLFYIYTLNGNVVGRCTCMICLNNG